MRVLCGYIDLNTCICGLTHIYAGIVATPTVLTYTGVRLTWIHMILTGDGFHIKYG